MSDLMRDVNWLIRLAQHLIFRSWPVLSILLLILFCGLATRLFGPYETTVRWTGLILQVFGFLTTILNLHSLRTSFNAPDWRQKVRNYFADVPKRRPNHHLEATSVHSYAVVGTATGLGQQVLTTEGRLDQLEANSIRIEANLEALKTSTSQANQALETSIQNEAKALKTDIANVRETLNDAMTGTLTLQWVGVFFFVIGLVLATTSPEIGCHLLGDLSACKPTPTLL